MSSKPLRNWRRACVHECCVASHGVVPPCCMAKKMSTCATRFACVRESHILEFAFLGKDTGPSTGI